MLSPEAPYPLHGGGAYRTASVLHCFARRATVDLIFISDAGNPALLPEGLVRKQTAIPLPRHSRGVGARYVRNAWRAVRGVPPLIDRLAGLEPLICDAIAGRHYDLGVIEHFWCAQYGPVLFPACSQTILNLHNVESVLHERCGPASGVLTRLGHARFAGASRRLEQAQLPQFSAVLAPSEEDARTVRTIAPQARTIVYPNALPYREIPNVQIRPSIVFSGNFEYHPNVDAVRFLVRQIWPQIRRARPELRIRLVGRGERYISHLIRHDDSIEVTGQVEDAFREIASAQVVVAPLLAGSGTRIKILEAWAAARPVVATTIAAEGLPAINGQNCRIADNALDFARAVLDLIESPQEAERTGMRARRTFEHSYTWDAVWETLGTFLQVPCSEEL